MALPTVVGVQIDHAGIEVETSDLLQLNQGLPAAAVECGVRITRFEPVDASLESVFRHLLRSRR
jgi:hypothetical protein